MASFINTEQTYSASGVTGVWLASNTAFSTSLNTGGLVNVAGPQLLIKSVVLQSVSGFTGAGTSGAAVIVATGQSTTSGGSTASGANILYHLYGRASGSVTELTPLFVNYDFITTSGFSTFVGASGFAQPYNLLVTYAGRQI